MFKDINNGHYYCDVTYVKSTFSANAVLRETFSLHLYIKYVWSQIFDEICTGMSGGFMCLASSFDYLTDLVAENQQ